jgi:hypothetical protein
MGMEKCKEMLLERGNIFLQKASLARHKIAKLACPFIPSGSVSNKTIVFEYSYLFSFYKENYDTFNVACCVESFNGSI